MPVRSLNLSVLKWPNRHEVDEALQQWLKKEIGHHSNVLKLGCFGSYAKGNWGVGSDLDLIAIVSKSSEPFLKRSIGWSFDSLPVPTEIVVYTVKEWQKMREKKGKFAKTIEKDAVWIYFKENQNSK